MKLRVTGEGVAEFEELWAARERGCSGDAISDKIFSLILADRTFIVYMKRRLSEYPTKVLIFFSLTNRMWVRWLYLWWNRRDSPTPPIRLALSLDLNSRC